MKRTSFTLCGVPRVFGFGLLIALAVALIWSSAALAQDPIAEQYPVLDPPAGPALGPGGVSIGDPGGAGGRTPLTAAPQAKAGGEGGAGGRIPLTGVLPATGGPMLLLLIGGLAVSGAGLVLLRHSDRGRR